MPRGIYPRRVKRHAVTQPSDPSYRLIPLTRNQTVIVDAADFEWLSQWPWQAHWDKCTKGFYAARRGGIRMHREILGCNSSEEVDHINHNTLDNRRDNLRKVTRSQNAFNRKRRSDNTTGFKGVTYRCKTTPRWRAIITIEGKQIRLGSFDSPKEAALVYDGAAKALHGEFAHFNFPERIKS